MLIKRRPAIRIWMVILKNSKTMSEVHMQYTNSMGRHDRDRKCTMQHVRYAVAISKTGRNITIMI